MTKATSDAIARAVVAVSIGIENGALRSRLCFECGDVDGPWHVCDVFPVRENREQQKAPTGEIGASVSY